MNHVPMSYIDRRAAEAFRKAVPQLKDHLGKRPFGKRDDRYGVAGNTLRAIRCRSRRPSLTFRQWAERTCNTLAAEKLAEHVRSQDAFDCWHAALVKSLQAHWRRQEGTSLSVAHRYKLIDLFVKWLALHDFGDPRIIDGLTRHSNCALDSQVLEKLNHCLSYALPIRNPTMGDVSHESTYRFCQGLISEFAQQCGGTRLLFDIYAWKPGGGA